MPLPVWIARKGLAHRITLVLKVKANCFLFLSGLPLMFAERHGHFYSKTRHVYALNLRKDLVFFDFDQMHV